LLARYLCRFELVILDLTNPVPSHIVFSPTQRPKVQTPEDVNFGARLIIRDILIYEPAETLSGRRLDSEMSHGGGGGGGPGRGIGSGGGRGNYNNNFNHANAGWQRRPGKALFGCKGLDLLVDRTHAGIG
jgi:hypothetical protein